MHKEKNVSKFNNDVAISGGYVYSSKDILSSKVANKREIEEMGIVTDMNGKTIIDIGCGDGANTIELLKFNPKYLLGIEPAKEAIVAARKRVLNQKNIEFEVGDIYNLPEKHFNIAILKGVLHHVYEVEKAIQNVCRVADEIIVFEPNGYNPILKIIEKTSRYHIEHEEKSYFPYKLNKWFSLSGGLIIKTTYIRLVPVFCPDWLVKILVKLEPIVESIFPINRICCGQYVMKISISKSSADFCGRSG